MPAHDLLRQAELPADLTHLVLEQLADRDPRPATRMPPHDLLRTGGPPGALTPPVLDQPAERPDKLPRQIRPQAAHVVVRLDRDRRSRSRRTTTWAACGRICRGS